MNRATSRVDRVLRGALWLIGVPLLRWRARRRIDRLAPGVVTVVTVNWNSYGYLASSLELVRRRSPESTRIIVIDNDSDDGSRAFLRSRTDVRSVLLPLNAGHDLALDMGFLLADTEYVVALDVDAFPIRDGWLDTLLEPLQQGSEIAGAWLGRRFVHPCCLAMRTARFVGRGHSLRAAYVPRAGADDEAPRGDVGELMATREAGKLHFFPATSHRGPGDVGTVFGDFVYHNFYATRFAATERPVLDRVVRRDDPAAAWAEALERYS